MLKTKRYTCRSKLANVLNLDQQLFSECLVFIDNIKQVRHLKTLSRHINKFNRLQQKHEGIHGRQNYHVQQTSLHAATITEDFSPKRDSNIKNNNINMVNVTKKWVVNMSSSQLTEVQMSLLVKGSEFVIVPTYPPKGEYIAAVEEFCLSLLPKWQQMMRWYQQTSGKNPPPGPTSPSKKPRPLRNWYQTNLGLFSLQVKKKQW